MAREISTPVELEHTNIIPGSEIVSIKGASIPALIKDADYIIDYQKGELKFLADGAAVQFGNLIEQNGIDVTYSYRLDINNPNLFESQIEVFDEVAILDTDFAIFVKNNPIVDVSRIFNLTTQETYTAESISDNRIVFSGINPPEVKTIEQNKTTFQSRTFNIDEKRYKNIYNINYSSKYDPTLNPVTEILSVQSILEYPYLVIIGGEEQLTNTIDMFVPQETSNIKLFTGARKLKLSTITLISGTDYTYYFTNVVNGTYYKKLTIELLPSAVQKIRTNNLYMSISFLETVKVLDTNRFEIYSQPVSEVVSFSSSNTQNLLHMPRQVTIGDIADQLLKSTIEVFSRTGFVYQEGIDYTINLTQKKINKLSTGRINGDVLVYYVLEKDVKVTFSFVSDVILVDYIWSNNSLNWNNLIKRISVTQIEKLTPENYFVTLSNMPENIKDILIYRQYDTYKRPVSKVNSINTATRRVRIDPVTSDGIYVFEYIGIQQPISEGTPYFVSYRYGATRNVLRNRFSRMVGIENTQTQREDAITLSAGATSAKLTRSPNDTTNILIYLEDDLQQTPVSIITSFDSLTYTLYFTSIRSSGRYVIRYYTDGFDTKSLRSATEKLFESFPEGPTLTGFKNIIAGFVDTEPEITTRLSDRFVVSNQQHTIGNQLALQDFQISEPLEDGSDSVVYYPSKFNVGAFIDSFKQGYIKIPTANNISLDEGTLEFLAGIVFDVNDQEEHYFVDILGTDPRKNRFSIYKSKNNKLNFDIWNNDGKLFRASADVSQIYNTEIIELKAGQDSAVLSFNATPAQLDINDNQIPDLYQGLETYFIIMPETPTFPADYLKTSIKVLSYEASTKTLTFEPVDFTGRYIFSYVSGFVKFEETENFIGVTWKLHTLDGKDPFYRLYINGQRILNQTLEDIDFTIAEGKSAYDIAQYDIDVYEEE